MNNFAAYGSAWLLGLSALFSAIKCIQTIGRIHRGDLFAYWGRGNSVSIFIARVLTGVWGIFAVANFSAVLWFFSPEGILHSPESGISASTPLENDRKQLSPTAKQPEMQQPEKHGSTANSKDAHQLTSEEIRQLETEKQYTGEDPVVRERLGLPPKVDQ